MNDTKARLLTGLVLEIFRVHGQILAAGDRMFAPLGLTAARLQVLGAVANAAATVAAIARVRGLRRQSVQRIVDVLEEQGLVELKENPHHRRARLVSLTARGRKSFEACMKREREYARAMDFAMSEEDIAHAQQVLHALHVSFAAMEHEEPGERVASPMPD